MGAYEAARDHGIDVPADLSIVGYDDQEMAQFMFPPLSTIQLPHYDIGREACMALLARVLDAGAAAPLIERKVACPPVARASVSAVAGLASKP